MIGAEVVHAPEAAGEVAPRAPRIAGSGRRGRMLQHLARAAIERPQIAVEDVNQMHVGRGLAKLPLVEELAVLVEHLHAVVAAVVDEDAAASSDRRRRRARC